MQKRIWRLGGLLCCGLLVVLVNACAMVGPDFTPPKADVSLTWAEADDVRVKKDVPDCADRSLTPDDNLLRKPAWQDCRRSSPGGR